MRTSLADEPRLTQKTTCAGVRVGVSGQPLLLPAPSPAQPLNAGAALFSGQGAGFTSSSRAARSPKSPGQQPPNSKPATLWGDRISTRAPGLCVTALSREAPQMLSSSTRRTRISEHLHQRSALVTLKSCRGYDITPAVMSRA